MKKTYIIRKSNNSYYVLKDGKLISTIKGPVEYKIISKGKQAILNFFNNNLNNSFGSFSIPLDKVDSIEYMDRSGISTKKKLDDNTNINSVLKIIFGSNKNEDYSEEKRNIYNIHNTNQGQRSITGNFMYNNSINEYNPSNNAGILESIDGELYANIDNFDASLSKDFRLLFSNAAENKLNYTTLSNLASTITREDEFFIVKDRYKLEFDENNIKDKVGIVVYDIKDKGYFKLVFDVSLGYGWSKFGGCSWVIGEAPTDCTHKLFWDLGGTPGIDESIESTASLTWDLGNTPNVDESAKDESCQFWGK